MIIVQISIRINSINFSGEGEEGEDVEGSEESDRTIREVTLEDIRR